MILVIDNYDSFVYNLARYVRELGGEAVVRRNDGITADEVEALAPTHIILSPGPCSPPKPASRSA
jgi:anthranilate/para-aminobenzoate synthase component II